MKKHKTISKRYSRGFTFVEMVIVGAVLAIISAIAIPIYSSYIENKRTDVVNQLAQTAAVSANSYLRRTGNDPTSESDLNMFFPQSGKFTVAIKTADRTVTVTDISVTPNITSDPANY